MTNKRFAIEKFTELEYGIRKDGEPLLGLSLDKITAKYIVEQWNDLAEENEVCKEAYNEIKSDAIHLKEENEQLKSSDTITDLETEIMTLKTTIHQLRTDNTKQKKLLNTTMKENEQLKCGNKNLKATLNDFINILNRLQSNPNNEQTLNVARDMLQNMGVDLE